MKITSRQINALMEITADTDEPIKISKRPITQGRKRMVLHVEIGKGKRAIKWLVEENGHSIPVAPPLKPPKPLKVGKGKSVDPKPVDRMAAAHKAATEAGLAELRKTS